MEIAFGLEIVVPSTVRLLGDIDRNIFTSYNRFYAFPRVFDAVPVCFKIIIVVVSFALFQHCRMQDSVVLIFLMIPSFYLRNFWSYGFFILSYFKLFLIEIDFWRKGGIQSFVLNFSLYLLIFFKRVCASNIEFILFKKRIHRKINILLINLE